jgi:polygalacturonase
VAFRIGFAPSSMPPTADVLARNNTIHTSCPHVPPANKNDGCGGMKLGYGTHSGIHNVLFEGNRVGFAGIAIKISSHLGEGGPLRNISFHNTEIRQTGAKKRPFILLFVTCMLVPSVSWQVLALQEKVDWKSRFPPCMQVLPSTLTSGRTTRVHHVAATSRS